MGYNDNKVFNPRLQDIDDQDVNDLDTVPENQETVLVDINNIKDSRGILDIINSLNIKINNANTLNYALSFIGDKYPIDKSSDIELKERLDIFIYLYTKYDFTPFMINFAAFCGVDRTTLQTWELKQYRVGSSHSDTVKKCREFCESALVQDGMSARNPAMQIFLLKNNHGYKDQVDFVASKDTSGTPTQTIDQISQELALESHAEAESIDL